MNRPRALPVAAKRAIARAYIAIGFACLALQAAFVRMIHHSLAVTVTGFTLPALAVLFGLNYLRQRRDQ